MKVARRFLYRFCARWRCWTALVLLPTIAGAALGVPVGIVVLKDSEQPFPCQDCPCSCRDAEACWGNCCCMTDREKLAWAQRHGVAPPGSFLERVRAEAAGTSTPQPASCPSCCGTAASAVSASPGRIVGPTTERWILLTAEQRCRGIDLLTAVLAHALPSNAMACWNPEIAISAAVVISPILPRHLAIAPPDPPPRPTG